MYSAMEIGWFQLMKICVADFTAVMGTQIPKFKMKKNPLKPLVIFSECNKNNET